MLAAFARANGAAIAVSLLFVAAVALYWNGIGPMDSMKYVHAALAWRDSGPAPGHDQWSLRLPLVAPIAASYVLFGRGEFASAIPNILYAAGLVFITFHFARRHFGAAAGAASAALIAASPFFVMQQTQVSVAGPEILFIAFACWLFVDKSDEGPDLRRMAAIGLLSGLAWLCRETAAFLPATIALILLLRWPKSAGAIFVLSIAFSIVVGAELVAYEIAAGDPFYRLNFSAGHRGGGEFFEAYSSTGEAIGPIGRLLMPFGHMMARPTITPFLIAGVAALFVPGVRRTLTSGDGRTVGAAFGACALVSFISAAYFANLKSPQYYPLVIYVAHLALGVFVGLLFDQGRRKMAAATLAALFVVGAVSVEIRSADTLSESRFLAKVSAKTGAHVVTDPFTSVRTQTFMRLSGVSKKIAEQQVLSVNEAGIACGVVYAATPKGLKRAIDPAPDWRFLWSAPIQEPRLAHRLLKTAGADNWGSARLKDIVIGPPPPAFYAADACGRRERA